MAEHGEIERRDRVFFLSLYIYALSVNGEVRVQHE